MQLESVLINFELEFSFDAVTTELSILHFKVVELDIKVKKTIKRSNIKVRTR